MFNPLENQDTVCVFKNLYSPLEANDSASQFLNCAFLNFDKEELVSQKFIKVLPESISKYRIIRMNCLFGDTEVEEIFCFLVT